MRFTERELDRMIEFIQWGIDKGVTDHDLNSALDKLRAMRQRGRNSIKVRNETTVKAVSRGKSKESYAYLNNLSEETRDFVLAEIKEGKKNRYLSINAIIQIKLEKGVLQDVDTERELYVHGKRTKNVMPEHEANLIELFEYCYEKMTKGYEPRKKSNRKEEYFGYLDHVSQEAKQFVIDRVHSGNKNVYHSIMSVLNNRIEHNTIEPLEEEYAVYLQKAKRHNFEESELQYVREVFEYCYEKINKGYCTQEKHKND